MTRSADNSGHWCCACGARIAGTAILAREMRGNLAEVCSKDCAAAIEHANSDPERQRFMRALWG